MDIGTAKVPPKARSVPYHCIDLVDPNETFTAALYQRAARAAIEDILSRGKVPVVCGGTGLYIRAALDDFKLDEGRGDGSGGADGAGGVKGDSGSPGGLEDDGGKNITESDCKRDKLREDLKQQAEDMGAERFHAMLAERDPKSAALIHPNNVRRVIRAFELLEQGSSYAKQHEGFSAFKPYYDGVLYVGLGMPREELYRRVNARVDNMVARGLLDEVKSLADAGFADALTAKQAIGYKELLPVLRGSAQLDDAVRQIKQSTRRYAKRQLTWFRRDKRIIWINASER
jgi:tRNA dimethylallyltransferase